MKVRVKLMGMTEVVEADFAVRLLEVVSVSMTIERLPTAYETAPEAAEPRAYAGKKRGRKPKVVETATPLALVPVEEEPIAAEAPVEPAAEAPVEPAAEAPAEPPKRRGRPPRAAKEAAKEVVESASLLTRFTRLVDINYDVASVLLEQFDIDKFSELKAEQYEEFSAALIEVGI